MPKNICDPGRPMTATMVDLAVLAPCQHLVVEATDRRACG